MTTTNSTTATGAAALAQYQATTSTTDSSTGTAGSALGKDAFLQLLVTQLKNQDPLSPTDNTQFVSQMAQFSSLESMQNLNTTVDSLATTYQSSQALQASSLVGRSVVVATDSAVLDPTKGITGSVDVSAASSATSVNVYDSAGNVIDTIDLGGQAAGSSSFTWDGLDSSGVAQAAGTYSFKATSTISGTATAQTTYLPATVNSVTMATTSGGEMTLNLAGLGSVALSAVKTIAN
jgi:flagellar basal-body rod modification protein FlgD